MTIHISTKGNKYLLDMVFIVVTFPHQEKMDALRACETWNPWKYKNVIL